MWKIGLQLELGSICDMRVRVSVRLSLRDIVRPDVMSMLKGEWTGPGAKTRVRNRS